MEIHPPARRALPRLRLRFTPDVKGAGLRAAQQRLQHPVTHGLGAAHHLRRHGQICERRQLLDMGAGVFQAVHQDQLFLGAGHGHIEKAHLLGKHFLFHLSGKGDFGNGGIAHAQVGVHPLGAKPQAGMHQHRTGEIRAVEAAVQVAEDHHGELQSLGAVDAHDLHAAGALLRGDLRLLAPRHEAAEVFRQVKDGYFAHGGQF